MQLSKRFFEKVDRAIDYYTVIILGGTVILFVSLIFRAAFGS